MRRTGRHKFVRLSIFFLLYSVIHIVSVRSDEKEPHPKVHNTTGDEVKKESNQKLPETTPTEPTKTEPKTTKNVHTTKATPKKTPTTKSSKIEHSKTLLHHELAKGFSEIGDMFNEKEPPKVQHGIVLGGKALNDSVKEINQTLVNVTVHSGECIPAAINQFPKPLIPPAARKKGALIVHIIVAVYMFIGLAIVCDEYFVASLDRICEELKMSPDVAGATFMAAGSSAPELATVIIGVFCTEDDIGISGVIGSAVFNIMFVISVCALATSSVVYLNWWPLIRDSAFYALSVLIMFAIIGDKDVNWFEALVMLLVYVVYCIVLHFNPALERWAQTLPVPFKTVPPSEQSGLVSYKNLETEGQKQTNYGMDYNTMSTVSTDQQQMQQWSPGHEWSPEKHPVGQTFQQQPLDGPALNQATSDSSAPPQQVQSAAVQKDYYRPKEYDPSSKINPLIKPAVEAGKWAKFKWAILYPIHFFCIYTMPDCRMEKYRNWYPFTFLMSMIWISFYSYFMVWMITIIGYTLTIPDTVMGLTFVAAGVSVPDALSSMAVIKEGYGDMAVSNAIGSNVFDILICLGLPWFFKTAIYKPGSHVIVISKGLLYSTLSLLSTVAFLVMAIHYNGWKLDRKFGVILMIWYLAFITFASLYELNVFGTLNPPECLSTY